MRINHNIAAIRANANLNKANANSDKSLVKLSSGFRINRAADDAAGMSISRKMQTQIDGLEQASRNSSDGISVIQTAEGALNEVSSMLQRMRELAVQSSNGTNTAADRAAIEAEIEQLGKEIERISTDIEFNTKTLLNGDLDRKKYADKSAISILSASDSVPAKDYGIIVTQDARQAVMIGSAADGDKWVDGKITVGGKVCINGEDVEVWAGQSYAEVFKNIQDVCALSNINVFGLDDPSNDEGDASNAGYTPAVYDPTAGQSLVFVTERYGTAASVSITCDSGDLISALGLTAGAEVHGTNAKVEFAEEGNFSETATIHSDGNVVTIADRDDFELKLEASPGMSGTLFTDAQLQNGEIVVDPAQDPGDPQEVAMAVMDIGSLVLQIGANSMQTMEVSIPHMSSKNLGLDNLNLKTGASAEEGITILDGAIALVNSVRSKLGAYQNRLEHTIANLDETSLNMTAAISRIEDTDMAEEMTAYTQAGVLAQAGTSVLAQANQRPQTVLSLLQG